LLGFVFVVVHGKDPWTEHTVLGGDVVRNLAEPDLPIGAVLAIAPPPLTAMWRSSCFMHSHTP
jgi:hypothetical protein